jgi:hypothetical protein
VAWLRALIRRRWRRSCPASATPARPGLRHGPEHEEAAFAAVYPKYANQLGRWFFESPFHADEQSWVLSKMWGMDTVDALDALLTLAPTPGYGYEPAEPIHS